MERERFELKVGIFVFVAIVALGAIITILGSQNDMFARQYVLYTEFGDVNGLKPGAPVRLAGLDVGLVDEIRLPEDTSGKSLRVRLLVRTAVRDRIRQDSKASIATQGVLGDKYVAISLGSEGDPVERGTTLPSDAPADYLALLDTAGKTLRNIESITGKVDGMVTAESGEETKQSLGDLISAVTEVVRAVKTENGLLHRLIYDEKAAGVLDDVSRASSNVAALTSDFKSGKGAVPYLLYDPESKASAQRMLAAAGHLEGASADMKEIVARVERGDGTIGALINDPGVYDDLRTLLGRAQRNRILRGVIRRTIDKNENVRKGAPPPDGGETASGENP